jgi:hypothetical protein
MDSQIQSLSSTTNSSNEGPRYQQVTAPEPSHFQVIDYRSPFSAELQGHPWTLGYKPANIPLSDAYSDPRHFLMSYEAAVTSASGNEVVLAKSFAIVGIS